jgi:hypothetical protein
LDFGERTFTFRRSMRAEPFQIQNFIDGQFVEPIPSLSFRAKLRMERLGKPRHGREGERLSEREVRNLWIFLRAAWYDPNAF